VRHVTVLYSVVLLGVTLQVHRIVVKITRKVTPLPSRGLTRDIFLNGYANLNLLRYLESFLAFDIDASIFS
jgi:hypothetical protein